jgi:hypothetical protein
MNDEICGKWMQRKGVACARGYGHGGKCASAQAMNNHRLRSRERVRTDSSEALRRRRGRSGRLRKYNLTEAQFNSLVKSQGNVCGMCHEPFGPGRRICIDHDHACCPGRERSCGKCVRGVLCLRCNITLGHIEGLGELARIYLNKPPVTTI